MDETLESDLEPIERRGDLRGYVYGVEIELAEGVVKPVVEAGKLGMFVQLDEPESYKLRDAHSVVITCGEIRIRCKVRVVRKEVEPRTGIALHITQISPDAEFDWRKIITEAQKDVGTPEP
ncbi:MAG: hypothetical protein KJO07_17680 [Deltaproteobacteria bacterium]|nr:hypothetical protein [Deltaproteobacteria bacterium]